LSDYELIDLGIIDKSGKISKNFLDIVNDRRRNYWISVEDIREEMRRRNASVDAIRFQAPMIHKMVYNILRKEDRMTELKIKAKLEEARSKMWR
jgi:hypothetical protein